MIGHLDRVEYETSMMKEKLIIRLLVPCIEIKAPCTLVKDYRHYGL